MRAPASVMAIVLASLLTHCERRAEVPIDPCLAAMLVHESHEVGADGVVRDERFQERYYRCGDRVWTERVLPPGLVHETHSADASSEPSPPHTLAKEVRAGADGRAHVTLVDSLHHTVFDVPSAAGNWDQAIHLVSVEQRLQMHVIAKAAPEGAEWLERTEGDRYQRVLWSHLLGFPLIVDEGTRDGSRTRRVTVTPFRWPGRTARPWEVTEQWPHREYPPG